MIANQVARLTTLLDLTTTQATETSSMLTTATIDSLADTTGGLQGQVLSIHSNAAASTYALLTATQQTKLATIGGVDALSGGPSAVEDRAVLVRDGCD